MFVSAQIHRDSPKNRSTCLRRRKIANEVPGVPLVLGCDGRLVETNVVPLQLMYGDRDCVDCGIALVSDGDELRQDVCNVGAVLLLHGEEERTVREGGAGLGKGQPEKI